MFIAMDKQIYNLMKRILCIIVTLFFSTFILFSQESTPKGFLSIGQYQQHFYLFSQEEVTLEEAQQKATELSGYLLSIENEQEQIYLFERIKEPVWLGIDHLTNTWASGSTINYTNFEESDFPSEALFEPTTGIWKNVDIPQKARYIIEVPMTYLDDCSTLIGEGQFLCADISEDEIIIHLNNNDVTSTAYQMEEQGVFTVLNTSPLAQDSILVENSQLIKKLADGTIAWVKEIPAPILEDYPEISIAVETVSGDLLLGGLGTLYADYPMPPDYEVENAFSYDSILVIQTDMDLIVKNEFLVRRSIDYHYGWDYALNYTQIRAIVPITDGAFTVFYEWYKAPALTENYVTTKVVFDSSGELIEKEDFWGEKNYKVLCTPCNTYKIIKEVNQYSNAATFGNGASNSGIIDYYLDEYLEPNYELQQMNGLTFLGIPWSEKVFQDYKNAITLECSTTYNEPKYHMTLTYEDTQKDYLISILDFTHVIRVAENEALIFYQKGDATYVLNTACFLDESCSMNATIENVSCNDNGTQDIKSDDFYQLDLTVEGDGILWAALNHSSSWTGFYNVPTTLDSLAVGTTQLPILDKINTECRISEEIALEESCSYDLPDLIAVSITKESPSVYAGDTIWFTYQIENQGTRSLYDSSFIVKFRALSAIPGIGGWSRYGTISSTVPPGEHIEFRDYVIATPTNSVSNLYLRLDVNYDNSIEELLETNNIVYDSVSIRVFNSNYLVPDFIPNKLELENTSIQQNDSLKIYFTVDNIGLGNAEDSISIHYYLSEDRKLDQTDQLLMDSKIQNLPAGDFENINQTIPTPIAQAIGTYYLLVDVNPDDRILEFDPTNNEITHPFTIIPQGTISTTIDYSLLQADSSSLQRKVLIDVYPNPSQDRIQLSWTSKAAIDTPLKIMDKQGRIVYQAQIVAPKGSIKLEVPIAQLETGIYFIYIENLDTPIRSFVKTD